MPNSTSRPFVSPAVPSIAEDDDFLSQHLSNLLIRQPSTTTSTSAASPPPSATRANLSPSTSISRKPSHKQRSPSIQDDTATSLGKTEGRRRSENDARGAAQGPFAETCDDLFSSFFVGPSSSTNKRQGPSSEPYGAAPDDRTGFTFGGQGRRGPPSVSMSTTFGARRRTSLTGTEAAMDENSDGASMCSSSSMSFGQLQRVAHPPGMLGRTSKHYLTNETALTTPPESSEGGMSRGGLFESCKALSNSPTSSAQDGAALDLERRPSLTVSTDTTSSQSPSSEEGITLSQSNGPPSLSLHDEGSMTTTGVQTAEERKVWFDKGGIIEPPDATMDAPDISQFDKSAAAANTFKTTPAGRHTSMMSRRTRLPRTGVSANKSSSNDSSERSVLQTKPCGEPSEGSSTVSALGKSMSNSSLISHESCAKDPLRSSEQHVMPHVRKASLVPAGDDGRTFKFVNI